MQRPNTDFVRTTGPVPSLFGILSPATTVVQDSSDNWIAGFTYDIGDARVSVSNRAGYRGSSDTSDSVVTPNENDLLETYLPFFIETTFRASTFALSPEAIHARAAESLDLVTQKAIEQEFWAGSIAKALTGEFAGTNRYLSSESAEDITPSANGLRPRHALALLEEILGYSTIGSAGTIHVPRSVASALRPHHQDQYLETPLGNKIVAGTGYASETPSGVSRWMYATGPVTVRVGAVEYTPVERGQAFDSRQNTIEFKASRPAAVTWSTSEHYAILVDLSLDYA